MRQTMNRLFGVLILLLALGTAGCRSPADAEPEPAAGERRPRMNILFIMADQHNARALGCYGNGELRTPSLDRLAGGGVLFDNAFCQTAQCCPSRYTILTGRYAHSHGLRYNGVFENPDELTVAEVMRTGGYATATIGKHHMRLDPAIHGFDLVVDQQDYQHFMEAEGQRPFHQTGRWLSPEIQRALGKKAGMTTADNDHHWAGFFTSQALAFLREKRDRPFCLWLSYHGPHVPLIVSRPWYDLYDPERLSLPHSFYTRLHPIPLKLHWQRRQYMDLRQREMRQILACYYAYISQIDFNIGRVLDELERLGLAERTIVVYTADHGEMAGEQRAFRKAVYNYDATVRVPLIIRSPGSPAGRRVSELVGLIDLLPTLCGLTGQDPPPGVQGRSLVPLLDGAGQEWREVIFSEMGYPRPQLEVGRSLMARSREHKYVWHENGGLPVEEFFDLNRDPLETVNLMGDPQYEDAAMRLREALTRWQEETEQAPLYPIEPWVPYDQVEPAAVDLEE